MTDVTNLTLLTPGIPAGSSPVAPGPPTAVGPVPPIGPAPGQTWWNTNDGQLYVWNGSAWVAANCCAETPAVNQSFAGLVNAANDAAAATAGVAVGHLYRNGSIVMVRVA